jgi:metal-dependent amidase/aminoacylase/carboxypeptidase family protein
MSFSDDAPTIAILGEMDSLILPTHPECDPATGAVHSCGHNASMAGMLGTAIGFAAAGIGNELKGKIAFIAVPAEECIEIEKRLSMIAEGKSMEQAVRFATAVSTITVSRPGASASIPTRAEAEAFLQTITK